jgi:Domain of unknown function (DUF929)
MFFRKRRRPGKATPPAKGTAAQRLAAQRAAAAEAQAAAARRRRLAIVGAPIAVIIVIVAALVIVKVATGAGGPKSGVKASAAGGGVISEVTNVPLSALDAVGVGKAEAVPKAVTAPALTQNGLPRVLYVGSEWCPYCATERWAMVVALSRFGTFSNLGQTASSPSDVYPSTATLTFHGSTFTSTILAFTAVEQQSNQVVNGNYAALDPLSAADQALVTKYDAAPYFSGGGIPFIDIGGKYLLSGASYDPAVLQGKTHAQIAAALSDPTSAIAQGALGTANLITAAICAITHDQPSAVCQSSGVKAATAKLTSGS